MSEVNTADVLEILSPIWHVKAETARAVRQRVRSVLEWAVAIDLRNDNPCDRVVPVLGPQNDIGTHRQALAHKDVAAVTHFQPSASADLYRTPDERERHRVAIGVDAHLPPAQPRLEIPEVRERLERRVPPHAVGSAWRADRPWPVVEMLPRRPPIGPPLGLPQAAPNRLRSKSSSRAIARTDVPAAARR